MNNIVTLLVNVEHVFRLEQRERNSSQRNVICASSKKDYFNGSAYKCLLAVFGLQTTIAWTIVTT